MIGIVADDITGANDIGIMFAKSNYKTDVIFSSLDVQAIENTKSNPDVLIVDTDSRFDSKADAYEKVYNATKMLGSLGAEQYFNKTCSVFRGNIGAEFDAMLDALEEDFAVIVLGFPKNGRKTIQGVHYVHGKKLEESEFRNDPMHPMNESELAAILQKQTNRKVGSIYCDDVKEGAEHLKKKIAEMKKEYQYIILDVTEQNDLFIIAQAVKDIKVLCGSSALAEELSRADNTVLSASRKKKNKGILGVAGSLMPQTSSQIQYMRDKGEIVIELDSLRMLDVEKRNEEIERLIDKAVQCIENGENIIIHSSNNEEKVSQTKENAQKLGMSNKQVSQLISSTIATIAKSVMERTKHYKLLVAGGDTSAAICKELGIHRMRVWKEIQPGLPSCITYNKPYIFLVLKSGSFGSKSFFEEAINHLSEESGYFVY